MAVTTQPQLGLAPMPGVPPGLEYLAFVDQLIIKETKEIMEPFAGFYGCDSRYEYDIFNQMHQKVYHCDEDSTTSCGPQRGFILHIKDNSRREVLTLERPVKCCASVCPCCVCVSSCCQYPMYIKDGLGQELGMTKMTDFCCSPDFRIFDTANTKLYKMVVSGSPCDGFSLLNDVNFHVKNVNDGNTVANVVMQRFWTFGQSAIENTYIVSFPRDMHVIHKALIFASIFLLNTVQKSNNGGSGGQ